jgi:uncharacterized membrane protein
MSPTPDERRRMFAGCCEHADLWHDGFGCVSCDCEEPRMTTGSFRDREHMLNCLLDEMLKMTATVAAPTGDQFGVLLAIFLVITFATVVVLWVHERRWDRHEAEIAIHHEQLATLAGRIQSLADFLGVDVHDARDDSTGGGRAAVRPG